MDIGTFQMDFKTIDKPKFLSLQVTSAGWKLVPILSMCSAANQFQLTIQASQKSIGIEKQFLTREQILFA